MLGVWTTADCCSPLAVFAATCCGCVASTDVSEPDGAIHIRALAWLVPVTGWGKLEWSNCRSGIEGVNELGEALLRPFCPSLKEGRRADQINAPLPYEIGAAGRSDAVTLRILTSPAVPWLR